MFRLLNILLLIAFFIPVLAQAEEPPTIGDMISLYENGNEEAKKTIEAAFVGIETGLGWANTELQAESRTPLYCQPGNLGLTGSQSYSIFLSEVEKRDEYLDFNYRSRGMFLLDGLKATFPCE